MKDGPSTLKPQVLVLTDFMKTETLETRPKTCRIPLRDRPIRPPCDFKFLFVCFKFYFSITVDS